MSECQHLTLYNGICTKCGKNVGMEGTLRPLPGSESVCFSELGVVEYTKDNRNRLQEKKLLAAVLRLETVLIDYKNVASIDEGKSLIPEGYEKQYLVIGSPIPRLIKIRSYADQFLEESSKYYQLTIVSEFEHSVLEKIAKRLDPDKKYFSNRVFAHEDLQAKGDSSHFVVFPATDEISLVLDSSAEFWKKADGFSVSGFIFVTPYRHFTNDGSIELSEYISMDIGENHIHDTVLIGISKLLRNIHNFYYEKKVGSIIGSLDFVQRSVFRGTVVCCPSADIEQSNAFEAITSRLGGKFLQAYEGCVTHVIVKPGHEEDAAPAREFNGVHIVTPEWFVSSTVHYDRQPESAYRIAGVESPTAGHRSIEIAELSELSSSEVDISFNSSNMSMDSSDYDDDERDAQAAAREELP